MEDLKEYLIKTITILEKDLENYKMRKYDRMIDFTKGRILEVKTIYYILFERRN